MPTYIAMLRGINIGPSKRVEMASLKQIFEALGFKRVRTYIQSGNVVFDGRGSAATVSAKIDKGMMKAFGFSALIMMRTEAEMARAIANNPFVKQAQKNPAFVHVCFLAEAPTAEAIEKLHAMGTKTEQVKYVGSEAYVYHVEGLGKARVLNHTVLEKVLAVKVTMRNWNTTSRLHQMAGEKDKA